MIDLGAQNNTLKSRQPRLRWYGQILRMDEGNKVKQTMKMEVRGTRAKGRPRMRQMNNIRQGINKCRLEEQDRIIWSSLAQNAGMAS